MKTSKLSHLVTSGLLMAFGFLSSPTVAQTVISGPNIMTSTWSPAGSPYIIAANCTVPNGQTLTILPGTTVWMGSGVSLTGIGAIQAIGTPAQRIVFEPPILSQMWNTIIVNNTVSTNQFRYCTFLNGTNALDFGNGVATGIARHNEIISCSFSNTVRAITLRDSGTNRVVECVFANSSNAILLSVLGNNAPVIGPQQTTIINSTFTNIASQTITGQAIGRVGFFWQNDAKLTALIQNCVFGSIGAGCAFSMSGQSANYSGSIVTGYGQIGARILNNTFANVQAGAISFSAGSYSQSAPTAVINNVVANAGGGLSTQDPWDISVQNNIFKSCSSAVTRSGALSTTVGYNDFIFNSTNFVGYPVTYGQAILANRNGTPCDVLFNIYSDPLFVSPSDFHLQAGSPCIDAGEGSGSNFDSYFPPSMGSVTNDIGAYGGPNAGQWIVPSPTNAFSLAISKSTMASVTINPPEPGNYRLEYASALLGTNTWIQITNLPLTTVPFTYTEPITTPARYYRAVKQ